MLLEHLTQRDQSFRDAGRAPFAALNAGSVVVELLAALISWKHSDGSIDSPPSQPHERGGRCTARR